MSDTLPETFGFEYSVKLAIRIPRPWAAHLKRVAEQHYDHKCRGAGRAGIINGLYNVSDPEYPSTLAVEWDDCDLIIKVLEQAPHDPTIRADEIHDMRAFFWSMMRAIETESRRLAVS